MIKKTDILLLLTDLESSGVDVKEYIDRLYSTPKLDISILKFINDHSQMDVVKFYEKLRKSYNHKSSKLYINIVKCDELDNMTAKQVTTTLTALLNQIFQFDAKNPTAFLEHVRVGEITDSLKHYYSTFDLEPAFKLLKLIKADLVISEYINNRRS